MASSISLPSFANNAKNIVGSTDGVAPAAGSLGEVIETVVTSTVTLSNTSGVFTDIASVVLGSGLWEVEALATLYADVSISAGVASAAVLAITNSSNTSLRGNKGGVIKSGEFQYCPITVKTRINTAGGTFKMRGAFVTERLSPTVSNAQVLANSEYPIILRAVRIA
jgi:hypothetical protein